MKVKKASGWEVWVIGLPVWGDGVGRMDYPLKKGLMA
jgi:hypothetical protein